MVLAQLLSPDVLRRTFARPRVREAASCIAVFLIALLAIGIASHLRSTTYNNYARLAYSILHGHLWIDWPGRIIDAAEYYGKHYNVDAPFPMLFVLPLAIFWGESANQTLPCIVIGAFDVAIAWALLGRLRVATVPRVWLTLFLFAGTDLWWCAMLGDVWFFAHVCAVGSTLLILFELAGKRRGWLVALLAFCAFESRFTLALAVPVYAYLLSSGELTREAEDAAVPVAPRRSLAGFAAVLACGAALWVIYNEALWGVPVDIGHTLYYHQDSWGHPTGSPFQLGYLPYELYSYFVQGPALVEWLQVAQWPYLRVDPHGVALTFTSPALVLAFLARGRRQLLIALWVAVLLTAGPSFLYYLNGWYQFGMRHALDFEPYLLVLMALAVRDRMPRWGAVLIGWSAFAGAWGVWYWDTFFRTGD